jgi:hypothetical protein
MIEVRSFAWIVIRFWKTDSPFPYVKRHNHKLARFTIHEFLIQPLFGARITPLG